MRWAVALAGGVLATAAQACPLSAADGAPLQADGVQAAWTVLGGTPIRVGEHFALIVRACPADAELLKIDAVMPAHRHGMNYRPSITALGAGRWRVEGLMWHMSGQWELRLDLRHNGRVQSLRQAVDLS